MPRQDIKQIIGGKNRTVAPAFSSLIHVVLQGSFCTNGVSGTIPLAQRDSENTHLMELFSHIDFSRRYSYNARYLTSPFPLSLPLFPLPTTPRAPPCVRSIPPQLFCTQLNVNAWQRVLLQVNCVI